MKSSFDRGLKEATIARVRRAGLFDRYPEIEKLLEGCREDSLIDLGVRGKSLHCCPPESIERLAGMLRGEKCVEATLVV